MISFGNYCLIAFILIVIICEYEVSAARGSRRGQGSGGHRGGRGSGQNNDEERTRRAHERLAGELGIRHRSSEATVNAAIETVTALQEQYRLLHQQLMNVPENQVKLKIY
ncbi:hypothetical protein Mgra_00003779 [Meloidogyne graminicola]|uniref:Uncharacterized protein n=1 Tax=Meloidogyne graminicola TaxID=189291 RepID=A0A8S9ZU87_9BILA|nr:hypothetical protein Mgra_00003779 [Meloidogyne graminicola]